jgi:hypothetical protein
MSAAARWITLGPVPLKCFNAGHGVGVVRSAAPRLLPCRAGKEERLSASPLARTAMPPGWDRPVLGPAMVAMGLIQGGIFALLALASAGSGH